MAINKQPQKLNMNGLLYKFIEQLKDKADFV